MATSVGSGAVLLLSECCRLWDAPVYPPGRPQDCTLFFARLSAESSGLEIEAKQFMLRRNSLFVSLLTLENEKLLKVYAYKMLSNLVSET